MEKQTQTAPDAPGADEAIENAVTFEGVRDRLQMDLAAAISCLDAILSDPDLLDSTAHFMRGRYINHLLSKQRKDGSVLQPVTPGK